MAEVEIAPRCPALRHRERSREAASGRSHVYHRAKHATGISLAVGIVPKAHTGAHGARRRTVYEEKPVGGLELQNRHWEAFSEVSLGSIGQTEWSHRPFRIHT